MDYGGRVDAAMGPTRWHRCGSVHIEGHRGITACMGEPLHLTFMTGLEIQLNEVQAMRVLTPYNSLCREWGVVFYIFNLTTCVQNSHPFYYLSISTQIPVYRINHILHLTFTTYLEIQLNEVRLSPIKSNKQSQLIIIATGWLRQVRKVLELISASSTLTES